MKKKPGISWEGLGAGFDGWQETWRGEYAHGLGSSVVFLVLEPWEIHRNPWEKPWKIMMNNTQFGWWFMEHEWIMTLQLGME